MIQAYIAYFSSISFIELLRIIGVIIILPLLFIILAWSCSMLAKEIINYLSND
jgi:hypothetical protein